MATFSHTRSEPRWFGEYELSRLLGTGGMAEVYEARRHGAHGFSKRFALKRMLPGLSRDPRLVQMFCEEARIQASLSHPNLVQVVEFGEVQGELFMALEFVDGFSCAELLSALAARRCRVDLAPALYVTREVLRALCYVHGAVSDLGKPLGLVHRDVAPGNILIAKTGEVKLADFGITQSAALGEAGSRDIRGKIGYISPEQALGAVLDARSDLFSLSVVFSEMLIGTPLFPGSSEGEILANLHAHNLERLSCLAEITDDARAILLRGLAHAPAERYASAREYLNDVDRLILQHELGFDAYDLAAWLAERGLVALQSHVRSVSLSRDADTLPDRRSEAALGSLRVAEAALAAERGLSREIESSRSQPPLGVVEYRLRRAGGTVVGPLGLGKMLELVATAKISHDTTVCRNAGPFLPLNSVHELARLASRAAYRFGDFVGLRATFREPLVRATLPRHLFELVRARRTGLLCARAGREQIRIYLVEGVPRFSVSTNPEHLLGERLLRSGLIDRAALVRTLEHGFRQGKPLGRALIDAGAITPSALGSELWLQCLSRLGALLGFTDGELLFVDGERSGEDEIAPVLAPLAALAELVLEAYSRSEARALLRGIEHAYLVRTPNADRLIPVLDLKGDEAEVLERLAPTEDLPSLVRRLHSEAQLDEGSVTRAVFVALSSGVLECI